MSDAPRKPRVWVKRTLAVTSALLVSLLLWAIWDLDAMLAWQQRATPARFFAVMSLLPAIGVPMTPLLLLAGATFGPGIGLLGSLVALALNLTLCYWIANLMRPRVASLLRRFGYELPSPEARKKHAVRFTLAVKVAPGVPAFVKNYWVGVSGVDFLVYFVVSMLTGGLYAAVLILLGEAVVKHSTGPAILIAAVVVAVGLGIRWWRGRKADDADWPLEIGEANADSHGQPNA
jgi:uncharacterized membrane protein YdjX (TVP38/TMEM64 family)